MMSKNPTGFSRGSINRGSIKILMFLLLMFLLGFLYVPFAFSLGVAHSVIPNNIIFMCEDSTYSFEFILQNAADTTKVMVFNVETQFPLIVGDKDDDSSLYTGEYRLSPNTNKRVVMKFHSPEFSAKFPVLFGYYEKNSGSGQIQIVQETSGKFYISVGNSTFLFDDIGIPYEYDDYRLVTYKNGLYDHSDLMFIEKDRHAKIYFYEEIDLVGFEEEYIEMEFNRVFVDSDGFGQFKDKEAKITFYDLNYSREPIVLRNGVECGSDCEVISYDEDDGKLIFKVDTFSEYTTKVHLSDTVSSSSGGDSGDGRHPDIDLPGVAEEMPEGTSGDTSNVATKDDEVESDNKDSNALAKLPKDFAEGNMSKGLSGVVDVDGVRKIFGGIAWGFVTLLFSVGFLLVFIRDNYIEVSEMLEADLT